jgi:hypothetical protein
MMGDVGDLLENASSQDVIVLAMGGFQNALNMKQYKNKRALEEAVEISERRRITLLLTTLNYSNGKSDVNRKLCEINYYLYNLTRMCNYSHILETNDRNGITLHQNIIYCLNTNFYKMKNLIQVKIDDGVTTVNDSRANEPSLTQELKDNDNQSVDAIFLEVDLGRTGCSKEKIHLL